LLETRSPLKLPIHALLEEGLYREGDTKKTPEKGMILRCGEVSTGRLYYLHRRGEGEKNE